MDARFNGYDDIMASFGLNSSKALQVWYDRYFKDRETMQMDISGFAWDVAQIDFAYEFGEVTENITAMATYLDLDSDAIPRGKDISIQKFGGYIPRMKRLETKDEGDFRRELIMMSRLKDGADLRGESPYTSIKEYLSKNLLMNVAEFPDSHAQSLTYQRGQMLSAGALTLTDTNNPGGIVGITFSSNVPAENVHDTPYWTVDASGNVTYDATKHPIEDFQNFMAKLKFDGTYGAVEGEIDALDTFLILVRHPDFKKAIGYMVIGGLYTAGKSNSDADARAMEAGAYTLLSSTEEQEVEWVRQLLKLDKLTLKRNVVGVAKYDKTKKKMVTNVVKAFNPGVLVIHPTGNIGDIKNVAPLRPDGSAISGRIFGGRGLIEYFYDPKTRVQTWQSELTALLVPNRPKKIHRFNLVGETATDTAVTNPTGNPKTQGYYEKNSSGEYVLAEDTTVQSDKTNYTKS